LTPGSGQAAPQLEEVTGCAWILLDKVADLDTPPELPALIGKAAEYARAVRGNRQHLDKAETSADVDWARSTYNSLAVFAGESGYDGGRGREHRYRG
jgi:hypothetical protein